MRTEGSHRASFPTSRRCPAPPPVAARSPAYARSPCAERACSYFTSCHGRVEAGRCLPWTLEMGLCHQGLPHRGSEFAVALMQVDRELARGDAPKLFFERQSNRLLEPWPVHLTPQRTQEGAMDPGVPVGHHNFQAPLLTQRLHAPAARLVEIPVPLTKVVDALGCGVLLDVGALPARHSRSPVGVVTGPLAEREVPVCLVAGEDGPGSELMCRGVNGDERHQTLHLDLVPVPQLDDLAGTCLQ